MNAAAPARRPRARHLLFWAALLLLATVGLRVHFALGALVLLVGLRMLLDRVAVRRACGPPSRGNDPPAR